MINFKLIYGLAVSGWLAAFFAYKLNTQEMVSLLHGCTFFFLAVYATVAIMVSFLMALKVYVR